MKGEHVGFELITQQFGNWAGAGWSAGRALGPTEFLTPEDKQVPSLGIFDSIAKQHDINYDNAARTLATALGNSPSPSERVEAVRQYFVSLAAADRQMNQSIDVSGLAMISGDTILN